MFQQRRDMAARNSEGGAKHRRVGTAFPRMPLSRHRINTISSLNDGHIRMELRARSAKTPMHACIAHPEYRLDGVSCRLRDSAQIKSRVARFSGLREPRWSSDARTSPRSTRSARGPSPRRRPRRNPSRTRQPPSRRASRFPSRPARPRRRASPSRSRSRRTRR